MGEYERREHAKSILKHYRDMRIDADEALMKGKISRKKYYDILDDINETEDLEFDSHTYRTKDLIKINEESIRRRLGYTDFWEEQCKRATQEAIDDFYKGKISEEEYNRRIKEALDRYEKSLKFR